METTQNFEGLSICSQLNLKIQDLNIQYLQSNPIYRRLYNIVANDTNKTQYDYRKNLIKQLYFLLKITPIMKPQLQNSYLEKLQSWYNANDHKKTELGSGRLRNLVEEYVTTKDSIHEKNQPIRPQSGVNWNKNVNPFLRPYTAKRVTNYQTRPQSYKSKFGQSTKASTKLQSCQEIPIRDFALSIREQFQVSQDFLNKNRTIHPQSEPIYEQLFSIIKKAGITGKFSKHENQDNENQILFQRDRQQFFNEADQDFDQNDNQNSNIQNNSNIINDEPEQFDKVSQQSQKDEQDQKEKSQENFEKKIFVRDLNSEKRKLKTVEGFQYLSDQNKIDSILLKKANNKYSQFTSNKFVNYSKDDQQMIRNYVNYTRVKSNMKKQLNRKSQSKRLLTGKTRSNTNLFLSHQQTTQKNPRIYSALPKRNQNSFPRNTDKSQISNSNGAKIYDFTQILAQKENSQPLCSPNYNQRKQLDKLYRKPIQQFKKYNKNSISVSEIKCKDKNLLTKYDCFLTRQKINPIANVHIQNHNQEALQQIEKIKQKVAGLGKKWLSTDSLMKALYIDSYEKIENCKQNNTSGQNFSDFAVQQKTNEQFDWKKRNPYFNMVSNGQKKMKKKTRKLHKK